MIFSIHDVALMNFPKGLIRVSQISTKDAVQRIAFAKSPEAPYRLSACYDFGPVPDPFREERFREALDFLTSIGLDLSVQDFFFPVKTGLHGHNPISIETLSVGRPMLVATFSYTIDMDEPRAPGKSRPRRIAPDTLRFMLFDRVGD